MVFTNESWTSLVVFFGLPWMALLLVSRQIVSFPDEWYDSLRKPRWAPPRNWIRPLVSAACLFLGLAGFLIQHVGTGTALHVALVSFLFHLVLASAWLLFLFEKQRDDMWEAQVICICALMSATSMLVSGAIATPWALFGLLPYCVEFAVAASSFFVVFRTHPNNNKTESSPSPSMLVMDEESSK